MERYIENARFGQESADRGYAIEARIDPLVVENYHSLWVSVGDRPQLVRQGLVVGFQPGQVRTQGHQMDVARKGASQGGEVSKVLLEDVGGGRQKPYGRGVEFPDDGRGKG